MSDLVIYIFDLFGTMVFAVTGALCGIRIKLDLLGVIVFGCTVGVGGGMLRDVLIGAIPVAALTNESYLVLCIVTGLALFFLAPFLGNVKKIIPYCDAIGLGVFTALGAAKGCVLGLTPIGVILSGVLTAVGGGVIRDIMARSVPVVLTSDFYATAALLGGILYFVLHRAAILPSFAVFMIVFIFVTGLRLAAMHYKLHLPVAKSEEESNE